jgi:hypothetical protein
MSDRASRRAYDHRLRDLVTMDWNSGRVQRRGKNVAARTPRAALG